MKSEQISQGMSIQFRIVTQTQLFLIYESVSQWQIDILQCKLTATKSLKYPCFIGSTGSGMAELSFDNILTSVTCQCKIWAEFKTHPSHDVINAFL